MGCSVKRSMSNIEHYAFQCFDTVALATGWEPGVPSWPSLNCSEPIKRAGLVLVSVAGVILHPNHVLVEKNHLKAVSAVFWVQQNLLIPRMQWRKPETAGKQQLTVFHGIRWRQFSRFHLNASKLYGGRQYLQCSDIENQLLQVTATVAKEARMVHSECYRRLWLVGVVCRRRLWLDVVIVGSQRRRHGELWLDTTTWLGKVKDTADKTHNKLQLTQRWIINVSRLHTQTHTDRHTHTGRQTHKRPYTDIWRCWFKNWGGALPSFGRGGAGSLSITQCRLGWGRPPYQVASWSIQPFGHNRYGLKIGRRGSWVPI